MTFANNKLLLLLLIYINLFTLLKNSIWNRNTVYFMLVEGCHHEKFAPSPVQRTVVQLQPKLCAPLSLECIKENFYKNDSSL